MQAQTIDEVISYLDEIIHSTEEKQNPMGYFAALYRKVTQQVKEGIRKGEFEDSPRMEKLDVVFANRYLAAYSAYQNQEETSSCWELAFTNSKKFWPIVLQHLLLGMNAHINLDLAVAAAQVCPDDSIKGLKNDFNKINTILSALVDNVEQELSQIWPFLKFILKIAGKLDNVLVDFSMKLARDGAWKFANQLAYLHGDLLANAISERDTKVTNTGRLVTRPGWFIELILKLVRLGEKGTVAKRIEILT